MLDNNNNQPHDSYFRSMMANINNARELLAIRLPEHIKKAVDLDSLNACKETYIDEDMKQYHVDTLYQADFGGREGYIYLLLEHQSSIDKHMPFRMLKYLVRIMEDHLSSHNYLPVIYPLVIYHGKRSYNAPKTLLELFNEEDIELAKEMLLNPCNIIDLTKASDNELKKFTSTGLLEYVLKNIYNPTYLLNSIKEEARLLDKEDSSNLQKLLIYVSMIIEEQKTIKEFIETTFPEDKEKKMASLAETWMQQGIEKGIEQGILQGLEKGIKKGIEKGVSVRNQQIALNMLKENADKNFISKVTGLSLSEINSLSN